MKRRSFLKILAAGLATIFVPTKRSVTKPDITHVSSGIHPIYANCCIRRSLDHQAVGRKLLMVDELPQGAYARYQKDVRSCAA